MSRSISTYKIQGIDEIRRSLERLTPDLQRRAYRSALTSGSRVIAKNAKRKLGKGESGLLKKSIGMKYLPATARSQAMGIIGPRRGMGGVYNGQRRNPTRYAHLVENGTRNMAAKPFIRPAIVESSSEVFSKMSSMIERTIARSIDAVAKKGGRK
jgi:HK97 gp10 family phage protein